MNILKTVILTALFLSISFSLLSQNKPCKLKSFTATESKVISDSRPWFVVYEENFEGNSLDKSIWKIVDWPGALYGNGTSMELNTIDNAVVENGVLKIITKKENVTGKTLTWESDDKIMSDGLPNLRPYEYTSSSIWTKKKFLHGKFEASIKLPKGKGLWPAFWLFGGHRWNEIDIFEFWNETKAGGKIDDDKLGRVMHTNVHYDYLDLGKSIQCPYKYLYTDFSEDFHVFTLIWEENKIEWFIDGFLIRTYYKYFDKNKNPVLNSLQEGETYYENLIYPDMSMHLVLNTAVQNKADQPDHTTLLPASMDVEWVRVYQRNDCDDVTITHASQIPNDPVLFNYIAGNNINIQCPYNLNTEQQLQISATNSINKNYNWAKANDTNLKQVINSEFCRDEKTVLEKKNKNFIDVFDIDNFSGDIYYQYKKGFFKILFKVFNKDKYTITILNDLNEIIYYNNNIQTSEIKIKLNPKKLKNAKFILSDKENLNIFIKKLP